MGAPCSSVSEKSSPSAVRSTSSVSATEEFSPIAVKSAPSISLIDNEPERQGSLVPFLLQSDYKSTLVTCKISWAFGVSIRVTKVKHHCFHVPDLPGIINQLVQVLTQISEERLRRALQARPPVANLIYKAVQINTSIPAVDQHFASLKHHGTWTAYGEFVEVFGTRFSKTELAFAWSHSKAMVARNCQSQGGSQQGCSIPPSAVFCLFSSVIMTNCRGA